MKIEFKYLIVILAFLSGGICFSQGYNDEVNFIDDYSVDYSTSWEQIQYLESEVELVKFDKEKWEEIRRRVIEGTADDGYDYVNENDYAVEDEDNPYERSPSSFRDYIKEKNSHNPKTLPKKQEERKEYESDDSDVEIPKWLGNLITFLVIILVAFLVFYLFFNSSIDKKPKKIQRDITGVIPTEIPKTELELLLEKALAKEDYREAIRIYFIFIIRGLIKKDWIEWEKEKTNLSYLNEMRGKPYSEEFESAVSVYEIVWYGERQLTAEEYKILEPRFKSLTHNLGER